MGRKSFSTELAQRNGLPTDSLPSTEKEAAMAQDVLNEDLQKLSIEEQEKLIFDIHGLPVLNDGEEDEDQETLLIRKLEAMDHAIQHSIPVERKEAYQHAVYLNESYVKNPTFQRAFLLANRWDPALAADQLVQHFETKKKLFCSQSGGGDCRILGREILQSDLNDEELATLESFWVQVLPKRDVAGRVVTFCAPGCGSEQKGTDSSNGTDGTGDGDDNDGDKELFLSHSMLRLAWYFQQCLFLSEPGIVENGYIQVTYNMGHLGIKQMSVEDQATIENNLMDGSHLRLVVEHFCYNDPQIHTWAKSANVFCHESYRHRLRNHFGSKQEVLFRLQTFGIPTDTFPINVPVEDGTSIDDDALDYTFHREWLASQRKREEEAIASDKYKDLLGDRVVPRRFDVLFGRGTDTRVHSGNLRAQHMVETRFEEYEAASKKGKTLIAEDIVNQIKNSYGRFLVRCGDDGKEWNEETSDLEARKKIAHFFRRRRMNINNSNNKDNDAGVDI